MHPDSDTIVKMQLELLYLRQEVELKKFFDNRYSEVRETLMEKAAPLYQIIFETVKQEGNELSIEMLCQIAGVSRSGYYSWVSKIPDRQRREEEDRANFKLILIAFNKRGYTKVASRIYMCLLHMDPEWSY